MLRRGLLRRSERAATANAAAAGATAAAAAGPVVKAGAARETAIARDGEEGGLRAALFPDARRLAIEAGAIAGLIVVAGALVYHFTVHTIKNERPVGGANVDVSRELHPQTEASFAIDPSNPRLLFGATNDTGGEVLAVYTSANGGRTWRHTDGPAVAGGSCAAGEPRTAIDRSGRQYLAFLAGTFCGDNLTPYLVVTSRAAPTDGWGPLVRVVPPAWKYGFDDAPSLAVDEHSGRLYLSWLRSLGRKEAALVAATSADHGRTWSQPAVVSGMP